MFMVKTALCMRASAGVILVFGLTAFGFAAAKPKTASDELRIDHIEIAGEYAAIHVYTAARVKYVLEASYTLPAIEWIPIWTNRVFPFDDHWVVADKLTNQTRMYRLLNP